MTASPKSNREKVREHRLRLRSQGLRPVQFWLPDVSSPEFLAEARRQSELAATSALAEEDQAFIESIREPIGE